MLCVEEDAQRLQVEKETRMSERSSLEERLVLLEDRMALLELEGAYAATYDRRDGDAWAALFTEDGIYQGRRFEGMEDLNYVQGRAALAEFCRTSPVEGVHYLHVPQHSIDGDHAQGRLAFQARGMSVDAHGRVSLTQADGYYDVSYRRTEEGWRIRQRFTVYVERGKRAVLGYDGSPSPFSTENPAVGTGTVYRDRR